MAAAHLQVSEQQTPTANVYGSSTSASVRTTDTNS